MVKYKMTKIIKLNIIIILFLSGNGLVHSASLYSPVPAPASAQVNINFQLDLYKKNNLEISYTFGPEIIFTVFPASAIPALAANTGIDMSFFFFEQSKDLFMTAGADLNLYLNPFIYNNSLYSIDCLASTGLNLSVGYLLNIIDNLFIESSFGGRISLYRSLSKYSGVFFYPGIFAELNIILKL